MIVNFFKNSLMTSRAKNKSLFWVKEYCSKEILEKEIIRRKSYNRSEVYDFLKEEFFESNFNIDFIEKVSAFLEISPIEVLEWNEYKIISDEMANYFLVEDYSWLKSPIIPERVSNNFLFESLLVNEQFYKFPNLVARLKEEHKIQLLSSKNIDLSKFEKLSLDNILSSYGDYNYIISNVFYNLINNNDYKGLIFLLNEIDTLKYKFEVYCRKMKSNDFLKFINNFPKELLLEKVPSIYIEKLLYIKNYDQIQELLKERKYYNEVERAFNVIKIKLSINEYYSFINDLPSNFSLSFPLYEDITEASLLVKSSLINKFSFYDYYQLIKYIIENDSSVLDDLENSNNEKFKIWKNECFEKREFLIPIEIYYNLFNEKSKEELFDCLMSLNGKFMDVELSYIVQIFFKKFENNRQIADFLFENNNFKIRSKYYDIISKLIEKCISDNDFDVLRFIIDKESDNFHQFLNLCYQKMEEMSFNDYLKFLEAFPKDLLNHVGLNNYSKEQMVELINSPVLNNFNDENYIRLLHFFPNEILDELFSRKDRRFLLCLEKSFYKNKLFLDIKYYRPFLEKLDKEELVKYLFNVNLEISLNANMLYIIGDFIKSNLEKFNKIEILDFFYMSESLFDKMSESSSSELRNHKLYFFKYLFNGNSPLENLSMIEKIFLQKNLPFVGKIFKIVEYLYPVISSKIPSFERLSQNRIKSVIFADLLKASFGSNNRSMREYLYIIENGNNLFCEVVQKNISYNLLSYNDQVVLSTYCDILIMLYNNTSKGKKMESFQNDPVNNILKLKMLFSKDGKIDYDLPDRIIKMFCHFSGIDTLEDAKKYMNEKIEYANKRSIKTSFEKMSIEKGDLIKGINEIEYLSYLLQNGVVAKEFLNDAAKSDSTPFDTDLSMVLEEITTDKIDLSKFEAGKYGPIWLVLKNDERFIVTRTHTNDLLETKNDMTKIELFCNGLFGKEHYGIRTGFASSEINYFLVENYDFRIGLEIAINGFYIPVFNTERELVFSFEDYKKLRKNMEGLSYYDENSYEFSQNLNVPLDEEFRKKLRIQQDQINIIRNKIQVIVKNVLSEYNLDLITYMTGNLDNNIVEFCETGSSKRGTSVLEDYDFDFVMRVDNSIFQNDIFEKIKNKLLNSFGESAISQKNIFNGDFRFKKVSVDDIIVDIDISFVRKTNKISYSTDMCIYDRLETIKKLDEEKYYLILDNIIIAKTLLKKENVYKPARKSSEGGLGGVGIENWILQHGGSFYDAAKSFVEISENLNFEQFKMKYMIWDFGENHLAVERDSYIHDNFIKNLSEAGYLKMKEVLKEYLNNLNNSIEQESSYIIK